MKRNVERASDKQEPTGRKRGYLSLEGLYHVAPRLRHMADDNGNHDDDNGAQGMTMGNKSLEENPHQTFLIFAISLPPIQHYHKPPTSR